MIFLGDAGRVAGNCSAAVKNALRYVRIIVTAGWSIYSLGYYYGYLLEALDETLLNFVYNVADFVNKFAFMRASSFMSSSICMRSWVQTISIAMVICTCAPVLD